jgi:hypothetical protein
MAVNPFFCLSVMDFFKTYVGNFHYRMLLIPVFVKSDKHIGHFSEGHDRVYQMKEREIACFKSVEPIMNLEWASIKTHH